MDDGGKIKSASILHPLATLEWTQAKSSVPGEVAVSCVYLNNRLFIASGEQYRGCSQGFSVELNLLSVFNVRTCQLKNLHNLPVKRFALTHYHSQLVLVGGVEPGNGYPTNKLWVSANGTNWEPSLPPMRVKRSDASAVNIGPQEYLVVVGGISDHRWVTTVEVLVNENWFTVQPLPGYPNYPRAHLYNGNLVVTEMYRTAYSSWCGSSCRIDSLLAPCYSQKVPSPCDVWKKFPLSSTPCILSLEQQLIAVRGSNFEVHCPTADRWLQIPTEHYCRDATILPTGEMMMVGNGEAGLSIYKGSLKLSLYDPDSEFTASALQRLQNAGFDFVPPLLDHYKFKDHTKKVPDRVLILTNLRIIAEPEDPLVIMVNSWLEHVGKPPTWRSLLEVLQELGLREMSHQIEKYLSCGVASLKELCMTVIMSGLLQCWKLKPAQLQASLPDYIPTTIQNTIVHSFKTHTLQLMPLPPYNTEK